jgi:hypothetical protein
VSCWENGGEPDQSFERDLRDVLIEGDAVCAGPDETSAAPNTRNFARVDASIGRAHRVERLLSAIANRARSPRDQIDVGVRLADLYYCIWTRLWEERLVLSPKLQAALQTVATRNATLPRSTAVVIQASVQSGLESLTIHWKGARDEYAEFLARKMVPHYALALISAQQSAIDDGEVSQARSRFATIVSALGEAAINDILAKVADPGDSDEDTRKRSLFVSAGRLTSRPVGGPDPDAAGSEVIKR